MTTGHGTTADEVLDFWFGDGDAVDPRWFQRSDDYDAAIRSRFGAGVESALQGGLDEWASSPDGTLALILLLDQFTRNIHRGSARAFDGDPRARQLAVDLVARGGDRLLSSPLRRWFAWMPLEHAEDLALQQRCVGLFESLLADAGSHRAAVEGALDYARRHRDVIARYGRFPHRNAVLGRGSTAEELEFLKQPGSRF